MNKPTFEQCLDYIETELGYSLLDWQKEFLHTTYDYPELYIIPARHHSRRMLLKANKLLDKLLEREDKITKDELIKLVDKIKEN